MKTKLTKLFVILLLVTGCTLQSSRLGEYKNEASNYSVVIPSGWKLYESEYGDTKVIKQASDDTSKIAIIHGTYPSTYTSTDIFKNSFIDNITKSATSIISGPSDFFISSIPTTYISVTEKDGNTTLRTEHYLLFNKFSIYQLIFVAEESKYQFLDATYKEVLNSFRLLNPQLSEKDFSSPADYVDYQEFTDKNNGFKIQYPTLWTMNTGQLPQVCVQFFSKPEGNDDQILENFIVNSYPLQNSGNTPALLAKTYIESTRLLYPSLVVLSEKEINEKTYETWFSYSIQGLSLKAKLVAILGTNKIYFLSSTAESKGYEAYSELFERMFTSFSLI